MIKFWLLPTEFRSTPGLCMVKQLPSVCRQTVYLFEFRYVGRTHNASPSPTEFQQLFGLGLIEQFPFPRIWSEGCVSIDAFFWPNLAISAKWSPLQLYKNNNDYELALGRSIAWQAINFPNDDINAPPRDKELALLLILIAISSIYLIFRNDIKC